MGMSLDDVRLPTAAVAADVELAPAQLERVPALSLRHSGCRRDSSSARIPPRSFVRTARIDGETVAAAISIDFEGDCGIFNVGTVEHVRRQGLATALTALHVREAVDRGCETASSPVDRDGRARVLGTSASGDFGRILEYVLLPGPPRRLSPGRAPPQLRSGRPRRRSGTHNGRPRGRQRSHRGEARRRILAPARWRHA